MVDDTPHSLTLRVPFEIINDVKLVAQLNVRSVRAEIEVAIREHIAKHKFNVFLEQDNSRVLVHQCIAGSPEMAILGMNLRHGVKPWIVEPTPDNYLS